MSSKKTGGGGGPWVEYDSPKPPPVKDRYTLWGDKLPNMSERCAWWVRQIERGWRPNKRIARECCDCSSEWYGVYIWEFDNVICPALKNGRMGDLDRAQAVRKEQLRLQTPLGPKTFIDDFRDSIKADLFKLLEEEINKKVLWGDGSNK